MAPDNSRAHEPTLKRAIGLPLLVLYGLGVTIGAGIYVLVGATAARAGIYAPASFLVAAVVMLFSATSFCELSGRFPRSAGEAAYVDGAFGRPTLTLATGALVLLAAIVSSAAISIGAAGYIATLINWPHQSILVIVVVATGAIAAWGIVESVALAGLLTLIEVLGLVAVVTVGLILRPDIVAQVPSVLPALTDGPALVAVSMASLVAFFAFVGFDGMVNIIEETRTPARTMPLGIMLTLAIATVLYFCVATLAVLVLPSDELATSDAPISLLFERLTGTSPLAITLIAICATLNGVVIQTILASRVIYGLADVGRLPSVLARLHPRTRTPVIATALVSASILGLALFFPIGLLAERTTQILLVVFILVNLALLRIKLRRDPTPEGIFVVPAIGPAIGLATCLAMLFGPFVIAP